MKRIITILILSLFLGLVIKIGFKAKDLYHRKMSIVNNNMPSFNFYNLNKQLFTNDSLNNKMSTIFIYFNTECDFCHHEIQEILREKDIFKNVNVLFISSESTVEIKDFVEKQSPIKYDFIRFLKDSSDVFYNTFGILSVPSIIIYDKNNMYSNKYSGEVKIEAIIKDIEL